METQDLKVIQIYLWKYITTEDIQYFLEKEAVWFFFTTLELFCKFIFHILAHWKSDALGFAKKKVCFSIIHGPTPSFSNI